MAGNNYCKGEFKFSEQNFKKIQGRTALHAAVIRDDTACLNTVLALINSVFGSFNEELVRVDDSGMNALHIAVSKQAKNVVKGEQSSLKFLL